jgi:hypothetical protein
VAVACLAGCGTSDEPAAEPEPASATIRFEHALDPDAPMYIEGAEYHVTVTQGDETVAEREIESEGTVTVDLPAGAYTLGSYARVCSGNCGNLEPPTDRCSTEAELKGDAASTASIVARPGGCTIKLD